jgi:PKD repeat protein
MIVRTGFRIFCFYINKIFIIKAPNNNSVFCIMQRYFFLLAMLFFCLNSANSQISVREIPMSFLIKTKSTVRIPVKLLNDIDTSKLIEEDKKTGIPNRYGIVQQMDIDIKTKGTRIEIAGKGYIWQYQLNSKQALSLGITFGKFLIPEDSRLFIYDEARSRFLGAFSSLNNNSLNQLTIADFKGRNAIIEYFEPLYPAFLGQVVIASVTQAYKSPVEAASNQLGINCPEGVDWQEVKHAVCLMTFHDTEYSYYCSGFLVNNVKVDGKPYFQTANHCISTNSMAATLVTYFNFENSSCNSSDATLSQTLSGATLMATNNYSDFTLLLLNEYPPASYLSYYAGWDADAVSPKKGTCIHHPAGTTKSIALDYNAPISYPRQMNWTDNNNIVISTSMPNTHWQVQFDAGNTEGGSSGSPLFDENQRVIGQLHGGSETDDFYGKFSLSWDHSPSSSAQLKTWLDPDNTGTLFLDSYNSAIRPRAFFSTNLNQVCTGYPVKFTDSSRYNPTSWSWNVQPSTYIFANGTTINSQNPEIIFNSPDNYSVTLMVANSNGTDSLTKINYIRVGEILVKLSGIKADSIICGCDLINYPLAFSGANNYTFNIEKPDKITYTTLSDKIYLSLISAEKKNGSFNSWINVIGTQGSCTSKDSIELKVSMPVNDDIENAIRLMPGRNKTYSNFCASVEKDESAPLSVSLKNTIWFTFLGPSSGKINIETHGLNDQIAVYGADSYTDLLTQNRSLYKLVASNNDRSLPDNTTLITNLKVYPHKMYWLQVDGSDGSTGDVVIDLLSNSLEVFPNPSTGEFNVFITNNDDGIASVKIASLLGQTIYSDNLAVTKENNRFLFDLSSYSAGIYFIYVKINGSTLQKKLLLIK